MQQSLLIRALSGETARTDTLIPKLAKPRTPNKMSLSTKEEAPAPAPVLVLGHWASPFVIRVLITLKLKGIEHEVLEEVVGKKSELLLRSNPVHKKIPVLLHHGKPISESLIIVQYIDEVWSSNAPAILPADPYARAVQRFWSQYIDDKIPSAIRVLMGMHGGDKDDAAGQLSAALHLLEEAFLNLSGGKNYFGGDDIGYLDIALGSNVGWVRAVEKIAGVQLLDVAKVPHLVAWADRFCAHPAVLDVLPDADKCVEYNLITYRSFANPINAST